MNRSNTSPCLLTATLKNAQDLFPDLDLDDELYDMFGSDEECEGDDD